MPNLEDDLPKILDKLRPSSIESFYRNESMLKRDRWFSTWSSGIARVSDENGHGAHDSPGTAGSYKTIALFQQEDFLLSV